MNDFLQSLRNGQAEKQRTPKTRKSFDNSYPYTSGPRFHNYGNGYQPPRTAPMKRPPIPGVPPQQPGLPEDQGMDMMAEIVDNLVTQVDTLVKNQEYMITVQERMADLLQRQADALEMVMTHFNIAPDMTAKPFENHYVSSQEPEEEELEVVGGTVEELLKAELEAERRLKEEQAAAKTMVRKRRKVVTAAPAAAPTVAAPAADGNTRLMGRDEIMDIINSMRDEGATYDQVAKRLIDLGQPTFSGRGEWHAQTIHRLCSRK